MGRVFGRYSNKSDIVERAKRLTVGCVDLVMRLSPILRFSIGNQLVKASGSVGANLVEAKFNRSKKDFVNCATISLKEVNETIYWLDILLRLKVVDNILLERLISESEEIAKIVAVMRYKVLRTID
jgi:four helix bundle protein